MKDEENRLPEIVEALKEGKTAEMDNELFEYSERVRFAISVVVDYPHWQLKRQVEMIMHQYDGCSKSTAYKLLDDAKELYPSLQKVNKAFERARLVNRCYLFLEKCQNNGNMRDGVQYMKLIKELQKLDTPDNADTGGGITVVNILKSAPEALGVQLPVNFDLHKFIENLEGEYEQRNNTIETGRNKG